jgi:hypothetical protein
MRQQAKPFTVEIKKSRKSSTEHQPLFGFLEEAARASEVPVPRLFERPSEKGKDGHNGTNGHADVEADIARVFGNGNGNGNDGARERPVNRILPDLTAKPVVTAAEEEEVPRQRRPRIAKTKAPRIPNPKPLPVKVREPVARQEVVTAPAPVIRVHRRAKDETGLARAERWKRRLPRFAR